MKKVYLLGVAVMILATIFSAGPSAKDANATAPITCSYTYADALVVNGTHTWTAGQQYNNGKFCIREDASDAELVYQTDGNLVWYVKGIAQWSSKTNGKGAYLRLQSDGNIGVYNAANQAVYGAQTGYPFVGTTAGVTKTLKLSYQSTGAAGYHLDHSFIAANVVRSSNISHEIINTGSSVNCAQTQAFYWDLQRTIKPGGFCIQSGASKMIFQQDGNLVQYVNGVARWNTGTQGWGASLIFQSDGNIGIYNAAGQAIWAFSSTLPAGQPFQSVDLYNNNGSAGIVLYADNTLQISSQNNQGVSNGWVF